jgi:hypothetical protein
VQVENEKRSNKYRAIDGHGGYQVNKLLKRILMVRNEPDINESLPEDLEQNGFKVTWGSRWKLVIISGS